MTRIAAAISLSFMVCLAGCSNEKEVASLSSLEAGCQTSEGAISDQDQMMLDGLVDQIARDESYEALGALYSAMLSNPALKVNARSQIQAVLKTAVNTKSFVREMIALGNENATVDHVPKFPALASLFDEREPVNFSYEESLSRELEYHAMTASLAWISTALRERLGANTKITDIKPADMRIVSDGIKAQMAGDAAIKLLFDQILASLGDSATDDCAKDRYWRFIEELQRNNAFMVGSLGAAESNRQKIEQLANEERHPLLSEIAARVVSSLGGESDDSERTP